MLIAVLPTGNIANDLLATIFNEVFNDCFQCVTLKAKLTRHIGRPWFCLVGLAQHAKGFFRLNRPVGYSLTCELVECLFASFVLMTTFLLMLLSPIISGESLSKKLLSKNDIC